MRVVSVNASMVTVVSWRGKEVETGIFKEPVSGRALVRRLNIDGDRQADLKVHGGEFKAVYAYSLEHYEWWHRRLKRDLPLGIFGENLTVEGLSEESVCVGDRFSIGGAVLEAVQPRLPCYKLGIRFSDAGMVKRFLASGRWGVYFRVVQEGEIGAGDEMRCSHRDPARFPVPEVARLAFSSRRDPVRVREALSLSALPPYWAKQLAKAPQSPEER
jgi:MOSC domain-containing protein YiiM